MNQFIHDEDIRRASHSEGKAEGLKLGEQRGKAEGLKLGEQKGRIDGKTEEKALAIRRMLKKLSVDDIVDLGYERSLVEQISKEK